MTTRPQFVLYGDGRLVRGTLDSTGNHLLETAERELSLEQVEELVALVVSGGLIDYRREAQTFDFRRFRAVDAPTMRVGVSLLRYPLRGEEGGEEGGDRASPIPVSRVVRMHAVHSRLRVFPLHRQTTALRDIDAQLRGYFRLSESSDQ